MTINAPSLDTLKDTLFRYFGHKEFRLSQEEIIKSIIQKKDVLGIMPTGGGKSACYQIPALHLEGITLVISPLISLMHDQVIDLKENGIESCYFNSSLTWDQKKENEQKVISGEIKIVYASPEGIASPQMLQFFKKVSVSLIAIDEAHCVSQWGHEFRSDYIRLGELKTHFPHIPILALTATADKRTREDIIQTLNLERPEVFVSSFDRPNIKYSICERTNEITQLTEFINTHHPKDTGIVYCLSRKKVEKVASDLKKLGHEVYPYHAGLSTEARELAQTKFNNEDNVIITATIAFGMGINRPDVRFVAHLDLPKSVEGYYQETGRAGRDGQPANAWMVYGLQDVVKLGQMIEKSESHSSFKNISRFKLDSMLSLCETSQCRRHVLLNYFGEENSKRECQYCDNCLEDHEDWDATVDAQKILSTIYRTKQMYGSNMIIDLIRGSKNKKILDKNFDELSIFGIGKDSTKQHWSYIIRQLIVLDYIQIKDYEYRNLMLTKNALALLKSETTLNLKRPTIKVSKTGLKKTDVIQHGRELLFEELRSLRRDLAEEHQVPPYIIFSDKSLHDMCLLMPRDRTEFLMVNGVGNSKAEKYGEFFLKKISHHQNQS